MLRAAASSLLRLSPVIGSSQSWSLTSLNKDNTNLFRREEQLLLTRKCHWCTFQEIDGNVSQGYYPSSNIEKDSRALQTQKSDFLFLIRSTPQRGLHSLASILAARGGYIGTAGSLGVGASVSTTTDPEVFLLQSPQPAGTCQGFLTFLR